MSQQMSSSAMFRCNECSAVIKGESPFWNHLSTLHFKYYPYRCDYCEEAGEIHFTATEDKMKKHTEDIHRVKDLHASIRKKHDVETQLQDAIEKCRLKTEKSSTGFRGALRSITMDPPADIKNVLCQASDALNYSILMGSKALAPSSKQRESCINTSETTMNDTADPLLPTNIEEDSKSALHIETQPVPLKSKQAIKRRSLTVDAKVPKIQKLGNKNTSKNSKNAIQNKTNVDTAKDATNSATPVSTEPKNSQERLEISTNLNMISVMTDAASDLCREAEKPTKIIEEAIKSNATGESTEISDSNEEAVKIEIDDEISTTSDDTSSQVGGQSLECILCDFTASHERVIKRHMTQAHIGKKLLKCHHCSYETVLADVLALHMVNHQKVKTEVKIKTEVEANTPTKK